MAAATAMVALQPEVRLQDGQHAVRNPIGIGGMPTPEQGTAGAVNSVPLVVTTVAAFVSLAVWFRRARGEERQQLKWFAYAGALVLSSW